MAEEPEAAHPGGDRFGSTARGRGWAEGTAGSHHETDLPPPPDDPALQGGEPPSGPAVRVRVVPTSPTYRASDTRRAARWLLPALVRGDSRPPVSGLRGLEDRPQPLDQRAGRAAAAWRAERVVGLEVAVAGLARMRGP